MPTRKDFAFTAQIIAQIEDPATRRQVARLFGQSFAKQNEHFKMERFLIACNAQ
jgi:hypothetical protein